MQNLFWIFALKRFFLLQKLQTAAPFMLYVIQGFLPGTPVSLPDASSAEEEQQLVVDDR